MDMTRFSMHEKFPAIYTMMIMIYVYSPYLQTLYTSNS